MKKSSLKRRREEISQVAEDPLIQGWVERAEYEGESPRNRVQYLEIQVSCSNLEQEQMTVKIAWKQSLTVLTF